MDPMEDELTDLQPPRMVVESAPVVEDSKMAFNLALQELIDKSRQQLFAGPENAVKFVELLQSELSEPADRKHALIAVMIKTDASTLQELVNAGILNVFNSLLSEVPKTKPPISLIGLAKLPVTVETLQSSGVGKTVRTMKKDPSPLIQQAASDIILHWTKLVETATVKKRSREDDSASSIPSVAPSSPKKVDASSTDAFGNKLPAAKPVPVPMKKTVLRAEIIRKPMKIIEPKLTTAPATDSPKVEERPISPAIVTPVRALPEVSTPTRAVPKVSTPTRPVLPPQSPKASDIPHSNITRIPPPVPRVVEPVRQEPVASKPRRKRVSWATEDNLEAIREFEIEDRESTTNSLLDASSFMKAQHLEHERERSSLSLAREQQQLDELPVMNATIEYRQPPLVHIALDQRAHAEESTERSKQLERERTVLQALYIAMAHIPPDPADPPQMDTSQSMPPAILPFLDPEAPPPPDFASLQAQALAAQALAAQSLAAQSAMQALQQQSVAQVSSLLMPNLFPQPMAPQYSAPVLNQTPQFNLASLLMPQQPVYQVPKVNALDLLRLPAAQLVEQLVTSPHLIQEIIAQATAMGQDPAPIIQYITSTVSSVRGDTVAAQQPNTVAPRASGFDRPRSPPRNMRDRDYDRDRDRERERERERDRDRDRERRDSDDRRGGSSVAGAPVRKFPCIFYSQGNCRKGDRCPFIHDPSYKPTEEDLRGFKERAAAARK